MRYSTFQNHNVGMAIISSAKIVIDLGVKPVWSKL